MRFLVALGILGAIAGYGALFGDGGATAAADRLSPAAVRNIERLAEVAVRENEEKGGLGEATCTALGYVPNNEDAEKVFDAELDRAYDEISTARRSYVGDHPSIADLYANCS